jgi:hypothetical protein
MATESRGERPQSRFGIGEWYGKPFIDLSREERRHFAEMQLMPQGKRPRQLCPFLSHSGREIDCAKSGGVCSLAKYHLSAETGEVSVVTQGSPIRTTCPSRFEEDGKIYNWIAEVILGRPGALPLGQVSFLKRVPANGEDEAERPGREEVGRIDNVLVFPDTDPLQWCAVEIQAVYFSGDSMNHEFQAILSHKGDGLPFPAGRRRPDYRSSGPKRLMPQLQIKVPTLTRWGKKTAVVVDEDFFKAMGRMNTVNEVSNCDVAWFVVTYDQRLRLATEGVYLTTLDECVKGLVAGVAVSQEEFEQRIRAKLPRFPTGPRDIPGDQ